MMKLLEWTWYCSIKSRPPIRKANDCVHHYERLRIQSGATEGVLIAVQFYWGDQIINTHSEETYMLVTFTTKAYADITMFGDVAVSLLKMMGHSGTVPSAILAADIPEALSRLTAAINAGEPAPSVEDKKPDDSAVSMVHRALPLIELLTAAAKNNCDVMWK